MLYVFSSKASKGPKSYKSSKASKASKASGASKGTLNMGALFIIFLGNIVYT